MVVGSREGTLAVAEVLTGPCRLLLVLTRPPTGAPHAVDPEWALDEGGRTSTPSPRACKRVKSAATPSAGASRTELVERALLLLAEERA